MSKKGLLCAWLETQTPIHEDDIIFITTCPLCEIPILIFKRHGGYEALSSPDMKHAEKVIKKLYGDKFLYWNAHQKHHKAHVHWHIIVDRGE